MPNIRNKIKLVNYSLSLLLHSSPKLSFIFILLISLQGFLPTLSVMASIKLGNMIGHASHYELTIIAIIWACTFVVPGILAPVISTMQSVLNQKATFITQRKIMDAASRIDDLMLIESAEIHDNLEVLSREASHRPLNLLVNLVDIFRGSITLFSLALVLASVKWWLPLALLVPLVPVTFAVAYSQMDIFKAMLGKGMAARLIKYYLSVILDVKLAKEIRIFNLSEFFLKKHLESFNDLENELNKVRRKQLLRPQLWNIIYLISAVGVMFWFVDYISTGKISVGGLLGTIQSISFFGLSCQWMVYSFANVGVCFGFFSRLMDLENVSESQRNRGMIEFKGPLSQIEFVDVCFSYKEGHEVLSNINLTISSGDHLAIVGENGAGKSTFIKLLCGLYKPTSGRILCNGVDLNMLDIDSWRAQISAVFQDFGHYNVSIKDNVTFGTLGKSEISITFREACNDAQFEFSDSIQPDTLIGKEFSGTDLSGGQWQRLALARAIYADGSLVILDEPTSAMDPRVEADIFKKFSQIAAGKTSVMVTHRLGSVKHSTKIVVFKKGRIVEEGTPAFLESQSGEYSDLLNIQKRQFH